MVAPSVHRIRVPYHTRECLYLLELQKQASIRAGWFPAFALVRKANPSPVLHGCRACPIVSRLLHHVLKESLNGFSLVTSSLFSLKIKQHVGLMEQKQHSDVKNNSTKHLFL